MALQWRRDGARWAWREKIETGEVTMPQWQRMMGGWDHVVTRRHEAIHDFVGAVL